jgi:hypothetical protein
MKKIFSDQSHFSAAVPVCTLVIACNLITGAQATSSNKIVRPSMLGSRLTSLFLKNGTNYIATGPTLPPPVDEDLRIATGPTLPPPVDEDLRIATGPTLPPPVDEDLRIAVRSV